MSNYYNLDGIITEIKRQLDAAETSKKAWEAVTFPTKKNGEPYAVLSKNISGATLYTESYSLQPGENMLRVCAWSSSNGYIADEIYCYCYVDELKDGDSRKEKIQNRMPQQSYLRQVYRYDIEDIKKAVKDRIELLEETIKIRRREIEEAKEIYNLYRTAYAAAKESIAKACGVELKNLRRMVEDTIEERYPYC